MRDPRPIAKTVSICALMFLVFKLGRQSHAAEPTRGAQSASMVPSATAGSETTSPESSSILEGPVLNEQPTWSETLRAAILTAIPDKYEDLRHWDKTKDVLVGVKVHQRGFQIRVSEQKRAVKHGLWHRYKVELIDPINATKLKIEQIQTLDLSHFRFQVRLTSKIRCRGDFEQWLLGVKGLNMTVVSEADVQVIADCELSIRSQSNRKSLLPDLILEPKVNRVSISLRDLDVKRIGEIRGDVAETIGDISRRDIENLLQGQEDRVVKKLNEAINKNRNLLRIPASRLW